MTTGRHGGHGGFPGHRVAGVCAQGAGARPPRGKSRRWRARRMTRAFSRSLRTATMPPSNSGGALVDARGNVVGIVAAKLDAAAALAP